MNTTTNMTTFGSIICIIGSSILIHILWKRKQELEEELLQLRRRGEGRTAPPEEEYKNNNKTIETTETTTTTTTMKAKKDQILKLRQSYFSKSMSVSYSNTDPLLIVKGCGTRLFDEQGTSYLDTRNNVAHVGHQNPHVVNQIIEQVTTLNTNTRYLHPNMVQLAKRLVASLSLRQQQQQKENKDDKDDSSSSSSSHLLSKVFFVNSGSEANDLALRLARAYTKSKNTIVVDHAYHGHTIANIEISPYKYNKGTELPLIRNYHHHTSTTNNSKKEKEEITKNQQCDNTTTNNHTTTSSISTGKHIWKVPCPDIYRGIYKTKKRRRSKRKRKDKLQIEEKIEEQKREEEEEEEEERKEESLGQKYAKHVQDACDYFQQTRNEKDVGAATFVMEGGMSVAGVILPPRGYLRQCVDAVRKAGGVYIADEVQTGFGRLGSCGWAFQYNEDNDNDNGLLLPDIVTVGKPFGNGMPLGAVVTSPKIVSAFERLDIEYFNTFGGNPVCTIAGLAVLDVMEEQNLQQHANDMGDYLTTNLWKLQDELLSLAEQQQNITATTGTKITTMIGDIRGSGLFLGIEFVKQQHGGGDDDDLNNDNDNNDDIDDIVIVHNSDTQQKEEAIIVEEENNSKREEVTPPPATKETSFICSTMKEKYCILTSIDGPYDNVLVLKPPMVFSKEDADVFLSSLKSILWYDLPQNSDAIIKEADTTTTKTPT